MNFVIGIIGANLTLGLISGVTGAANSIHTLSSTILRSTESGADEVKQIISETDLETKIKTTQFMLCELRITESSPYTIIYCIQAIKDAIKGVADELDQIYYRMQYNNNIWIGSYVRAFKFHNNKSRLHAKLKNLESRTQALVSVMSIQGMMYKNTALLNELGDLDESLQKISHTDAKGTEMIKRTDLHKKLEFMR